MLPALVNLKLEGKHCRGDADGVSIMEGGERERQVRIYEVRREVNFAFTLSAHRKAVPCFPAMQHPSPTNMDDLSICPLRHIDVWLICPQWRYRVNLRWNHICAVWGNCFHDIYSFISCSLRTYCRYGSATALFVLFCFSFGWLASKDLCLRVWRDWLITITWCSGCWCFMAEWRKENMFLETQHNSSLISLFLSCWTAARS